MSDCYNLRAREAGAFGKGARALGIALIAALALTGCGGFRILSKSEPENAARVDADLEILLPPGDILPGWTRGGRPKQYDRNDLTDYVNGGAERYFSYGFRRIITAEYVRDNNAEMSFVLDIYDMGTPRGAFGIYSQARIAATRFLAIGGEGFAGPSNLEFWKGPYYARLIAFSTAPEIQPVLQTFASNVAARIAVDSTPPPEIALFPPGAKVPHSEQFIPRSALGIDGLDDCFVASYVLDGSRCDLYLHQGESDDSVQRLLSLVARQSEIAREVDGFLEVRLPYRGTGYAFADAGWFGLAIGDGSQKMKQALCVSVQLRLPRR